MDVNDGSSFIAKTTIVPGAPKTTGKIRLSVHEQSYQDHADNHGSLGEPIPREGWSGVLFRSPTAWGWLERRLCFFG